MEINLLIMYKSEAIIKPLFILSEFLHIYKIPTLKTKLKSK